MSSPKAQRKLEVLKSLEKYNDDAGLVLPLHEYFEYADDECIGCNSGEDGACKLIYEQLKAIEKRDDVKEIWVHLVGICGVGEPRFAEPEWFFSDEVYIVGSISVDELKAIWQPFASMCLCPDEIVRGWLGKEAPDNLPHPIDKTEVVTLWWD
jgi:hypothetical protein